MIFFQFVWIILFLSITKLDCFPVIEFDREKYMQQPSPDFEVKFEYFIKLAKQRLKKGVDIISLEEVILLVHLLEELSELRNRFSYSERPDYWYSRQG